MSLQLGKVNFRIFLKYERIGGLERLKFRFFIKIRKLYLKKNEKISVF